MKQFLPFLFIFIFTNVHAQLEITPNDETKIEILNLTDDGSNTKIHYNIINTGTEDVSLRWCIEQLSGPEAWEPQICVNVESGGCFGWGILCNVDPTIGLDYPFVIAAGDTSLLDIGIKPFGEAGCGSFKVEIKPYFSPAILATGNYNFEINMDADCIAVPTEDLEKSKVHIFPNPTNSNFTISENEFVKEVEIYNLVGQMILGQKYNNGDTFDLSNHPDGIYLVKMKDQDGQVFKSTKLVKR